MAHVNIIDDDETMVSLLGTLLTIEGHAVQPVFPADIGDLVAPTNNNIPDLIILDVHLREINGLDILRQFRQDDRFRQVKVIMTSGMDLSERCMREGANAFLVKPYMPEELIGLIHDQLMT